MTRRISRPILAATLAVALATAAGCGGDEPATPPTPIAPSPSPAVRDGESPAVRDGESPAAPPPTPTSPADDRPAFASVEQCAKCHVEIAKEWRESFHGLAMVDPLFLEKSDGLRQEECIRCHAPVPLRETGDGETPIARTNRREDAVSCLTCHQSRGSVTGPFEGLSGPCRPVFDPAQRDVTKMCFGCHNQHKTGEEWLAGPYAPDAPEPRRVEMKTCLDCHMPLVDRPLVAGGPVRTGRRHTWPGGHDLSHVKKALTLEVEAEVGDGGTRVRTFVTNVGAGHNVPTDARHRSFDVYVKVWDAQGRLVLDPLDPVQQAKSQSAKYRLFYRNSGLVDTQVPPLARVSGLGSWKGYVDVPGITQGRGEAWLVYRLTPEDALVEDSLANEVFVERQARRVAVATFTFGGAK